MIEHLSGSVTFPINGVGLNVNLSLQPGITAIIGENGSGKTFSGSELPRWLLFGKKALRGKADDYKMLTGKGRFIIGGEPYAIERGPKGEQITDKKGTILAVGAEAVTKKVEELFGYGLEVFDICNASPQKRADMFGAMQPAKRKRMVDRVIGLTSNEKVEKLCRDEAGIYRREAEALTRRLRAPVKPAMPGNYRVSADALEKELDRHRERRRKLAALTAQLVPVALPEVPRVERVSASTIDLLQAQQDAYTDNKRERARLQAILNECIAYDPNDWTEDQLIAAEARLVAKAEIERRGARPAMSPQELIELRHNWNNHNYSKERSDEIVTCPKCDHKFRSGGELWPQPEIDEATMRAEARAHEVWADGDVDVPPGPDLTRKQIDHARRARAAKERHDAARAELDVLPILFDMSVPLNSARQDAAEWTAYERAMIVAERQQEANEETERKLRELGDVMPQELVDALADQLSEAKVYETQLAEYRRVQTEFTDLSAQIAEKSKMAEEFMKGATALSTARATVKSFLAPALSRVASAIIDDMTLGKLSSVVVDDDMEITVNGQRLETLSGAGETVANIALRIALGQVLVANTFPVFLGDEMDSDADDRRRQATAEAIRNLKSRLSQIILITHRDVEIADHVINLNDAG